MSIYVFLTDADKIWYKHFFLQEYYHIWISFTFIQDLYYLGEWIHFLEYLPLGENVFNKLRRNQCFICIRSLFCYAVSNGLYSVKLLYNDTFKVLSWKLSTKAFRHIVRIPTEIWTSNLQNISQNRHHLRQLVLESRKCNVKCYAWLYVMHWLRDYHQYNTAAYLVVAIENVI
jgi:hypothetical protein